MSKRKVSESMKKSVAGRQFYKCANSPGSKVLGTSDYKCPLWEKEGSNKGSFDESGYEIDHIVEHSISGNDNIENVQALCKMCHSVKTRIFMRTKKSSSKKSSSKFLFKKSSKPSKKSLSKKSKYSPNKSSLKKCPNCTYST